MASKTKKTVETKTETETKTTEQKIEVNGSYDFLVQHFAEPSSIIDAATALVQHNGADPDIAMKRVEQFLENAKIDRTLEVRAGTGSNEGQYIIARVPQSAQRKNGGREVKTQTRKTKDVEKTRSHAAKKEPRSSQQGIAIKYLMGGFRSIDDIVAHLQPLFKDKTLERLRGTTRWLLGNPKGLFDKADVKLEKKTTKDNKLVYTLVKN